MRRSYGVFLALFFIAIGLHAQADPPLRLIKTIFLPGYAGDFEHFAADIKGNRLFLIAEDHKTVEVLDIRTGRRIHTITGFGQPHAIEYLAEIDPLQVCPRPAGIRFSPERARRSTSATAALAREESRRAGFQLALRAVHRVHTRVARRAE